MIVTALDGYDQTKELQGTTMIRNYFRHGHGKNPDNYTKIQNILNRSVSPRAGPRVSPRHVITDPCETEISCVADMLVTHKIDIPGPHLID